MAIAVVIVAVVGVALVVLPALLPFGSDGSVGATFYDRDGKPIFMPAFVRNTKVVYSFDGTVTWAVSGSGSLDTGSVDVSIEFYFEIVRNTYSGGLLFTSTKSTWASGDVSGSKTSTQYPFETYLADYMAYKSEGWGFVLHGKVWAAGDVDGERVEKTWSGQMTFLVTYQAGELYVSGSVTG